MCTAVKASTFSLSHKKAAYKTQPLFYQSSRFLEAAITAAETARRAIAPATFLSPVLGESVVAVFFSAVVVACAVVV